MNCLVVTPHRLGIREMAERVGKEWTHMGHDVKYILADGAAARLGSVTIGVPGIAAWWYLKLKEIAANHTQYDLIWTHQPVTLTSPSADKSFWNKFVVTIHTTLSREYELAQEGIYSKHLLPYYWLAKTVESRFHHKLRSFNASGPHYTVVSPHLKTEVSPFGINQPTYIPNGTFTPTNRNLDSIRAEYNIPKHATVVFNIGSLTQQKRPILFAELMQAVVNELNKSYVVMAGDGPLSEAVEAHTSERLRTLGYVDDDKKWRWFMDSDIFVSLSAYEGMPIATAEALSFNLPVILSDIPSHRHLLKEYDVTGSLVDDDINEIISAIRRLRNKDSNVSLPGWRAIAGQYLDIVR